MKKSISATLLTIFFLTSCAAQTKINVSKNLDQQAPPDEIAAIQLLESLLKDPKIVNKNWQGMKESFPKGCEKSLDRYDLDCPPVEGIARIAASASGHGLIELTFIHPISCGDIRSIITKRFGTAEYSSPNGCSGNWSLSKHLKTGYLRISQGKKDATKTTVQFGVEQGP